jgi:uncharacterized membrane protein
VLWSNLHLLFWLSLLPVATGFMGENHFAPLPVALYGVDLLMCAVAYFILVHSLLASHGRDSEFARRVGADWKGKIPLAAYAAGVALAFIEPWASLAIYAGVAAAWFIPDRRFER